MSSSLDPDKCWDLSLYELHRSPQSAVSDPSVEIAVSARSLESELRCPICLEILVQTMTTKECLHRFCSKCIVTALRSGNKECPTCRKKLISKRSLRPDPNFDALVEKIFPNREEYDARQDSIIEEINRTHSQNFIATVQVGYKAQLANVKQHNRKNKTDYDREAPDSPHHTPITGARSSAAVDSDDDDAPTHPPPKKKKKLKAASVQASADADASDSSAGGSSAQEIEIVFKLHQYMIKDVPQAIRDNSTRYIKTTSKAHVEHLLKYLAMRLSVDFPKSANSDGVSSKVADQQVPPGQAKLYAGVAPGVEDLVIYVDTAESGMVEINPEMTLQDVKDKHWKQNKPMELFYTFYKPKKK